MKDLFKGISVYHGVTFVAVSVLGAIGFNFQHEPQLFEAEEVNESIAKGVKGRNPASISQSHLNTVPQKEIKFTNTESTAELRDPWSEPYQEDELDENRDSAENLAAKANTSGNSKEVLSEEMPLSPPQEGNSSNKKNSPKDQPPRPLINNGADTVNCLSCVGNTTKGDSEDTPTNDEIGESDGEGSVSSHAGNSFTNVSIEEAGFQCFLNLPQGKYHTTTSVELECTEEATITYCLAADSVGCDPVTSGSVYTTPLSIGPADGVYTLSFSATSDADGEETEKTYKRIIIESGGMEMESSFPLVYFQSTQIPYMASTTSNSFGGANRYYSFYNLKSNNPGPGGFNLNCSSLLSSIDLMRSPAAVAIDSEVDVSSLLSGTTLNSTVDSDELEGVDNYLVSFLEDRNINQVLCRFTKVSIVDFPLASFSSGGETPVSSGVKTTMGHFVGFGHFQGVANSTVSGLKENEQSNTQLRDDFISITFGTPEN